ncbi:rhomboid family intramembrane serine protease [Haloparvum sedimenti]|uniref:rhomboid family intramembrane serine protease n=1 Tax=Haloparvum sedimenti TaxID=1678448 RepID=UPI00071E8840|nr:rhomboid family intramembrane serine protease [Haloparvum sedimenti]
MTDDPPRNWPVAASDFLLPVAVAALYGVVYLAQLTTVVRLGGESHVFWFLATADPSPGWLLAPFAHASPGHAATNAALTVLFGGLVVSLAGRRTFLGLFAVASSLAIGGSVVLYNLGPLAGGAAGASAAGFAFVGYVAVRSRDLLSPDAASGTDRHRIAAAGAGVVLVAVVGAQVAADLSAVRGLEGVAAAYGHLVGAAAGVAAARRDG